MLGKVLQGKLLTRQFLKGLGITQEDHCVLCIQDTETVDHLFFSCSFSAYLWQLCKLKLGFNPSISNLVDEASKIKFKVRRKCNTSTLAKLVLSALVWHIRRERNNMTFKHESKNEILVLKELYKDVQTLMQQGVWKYSTQVH